MAIYTRFGSKVTIISVEQDNQNTWLKVRIEDGSIREWAAYEFRADGGFAEIQSAMDAAPKSPTRHVIHAEPAYQFPYALDVASWEQMVYMEQSHLAAERLHAELTGYDAHGNALCERCHRNPIFYADSERFCQSCLLAIESEYDAKIAREEAQSLYNSDSGVDADDYRAHMDTFAPELVSEPKPAPEAASEAVADAGDKPARQYQSGDIVKTYQHTITGVVGANGSPDGINVEVKWSYATEVVKSVDLILVTPIEEQDTWQGAYVRLRAENEALKQQLATARANLAVAQKALIAITSVKYDDMQAVRDRAETGLIESDYYVASLK